MKFIILHKYADGHCPYWAKLPNFRFGDELNEKHIAKELGIDFEPEKGDELFAMLIPDNSSFFTEIA